MFALGGASGGGSREGRRCDWLRLTFDHVLSFVFAVSSIIHTVNSVWAGASARSKLVGAGRQNVSINEWNGSGS